MIDETIWHKCRFTFLPHRTVNGGWTWGAGQTWRRRNTDGKWKYQQDDETAEAWLDRQW